MFFKNLLLLALSMCLFPCLGLAGTYSVLLQVPVKWFSDGPVDHLESLSSVGSVVVDEVLSIGPEVSRLVYLVLESLSKDECCLSQTESV